MPTFRTFDTMLDALLSSTKVWSTGNTTAIDLLKAQKNLVAYWLTDSVQHASAQLGLVGSPEGRQVVFASIRIEELPIPLWIEKVNPATKTRQGFLIEVKEQGAWTVSIYAEDEDSYRTAARIFNLVRDQSGFLRVEPGPASHADKGQLQKLGEGVMAVLAILCAPMLAQVVNEKPPRRGMAQFKRVRMAEPWTDLHQQGIPKLGKATRPNYVADELLDEISIFEGRIWYGLYQFRSISERSHTLRHLNDRRLGIDAATRFVLSPLTAAAAAEIADRERVGMMQARFLVVLPDFLTWIEWRDVSCGVPGQRFGLLLQAVEDNAGPSDAKGLLFALPENWILNKDSFNIMPMITLNLRLNSQDAPLLEVTDFSNGMIAFEEVDSGRLGRFLLAVLTFIGQPRMVEQAETHNGITHRAINQARAAKCLHPQVSMKEVRLIIDLPGELKEELDTKEKRSNHHHGTLPGGMPWHRVRMFWRWRLGRLEVVRPHTRGSVENGVSRRVTLLLHPNEVTTRVAR